LSSWIRFLWPSILPDAGCEELINLTKKQTACALEILFASQRVIYLDGRSGIEPSASLLSNIYGVR